MKIPNQRIMKNKPMTASEMGKKRWASVTPEKRTEMLTALSRKRWDKATKKNKNK